VSKDKKKSYRSIFISDVHLGTRHSNAKLLLEFLKETEADRYYLVGDIIDGWMMRKNVYWPQEHNEVVQFFLKQSKKSVEVIFVIGNHDEFLREYSGTEMGNIKLVNEVIHHGENNKKYLVIHGDQFDLVTKNARWLAYIGGWMYDRMIDINRYLQWVYNALNINGFSLSAWAKSNVKEAVNFIGDYEKVVADAAKRRCVDGVICGHIHSVNISTIDGIEYVNCGDWVESCTAIVEHYNGKFEIIRKL
jgi:UDP-2,3-diacylglucosamine pyrophosphatase LpxH